MIRRSPQRDRFPPGPRGSLMLGSWRAMDRDILGFLTGALRDYGDVVGFRALGLPFCLLGRPDHIEQVLVRDSDRFVKSMDYRVLRAVLGQGLLTSEGDLWRTQRRLTQPAFHADRVQTCIPVFAREAEATAARWPRGAMVDVHTEMMRLTLRIVAEALFHSVVDDDIRTVRTALAAVNDAFTGFPFPLWIPFPRHVRAWRHLGRLRRMIERLIDEARAAPAGRRDLLAGLLAARDAQGRSMSLRQLRDELLTVFLAGHETTAIALSFTLRLIARHPDVERRLREEWNEALGENSVTAAVLPELAYTRAVLQEAMRLYPPAWVIGRETTAAYEIGDFLLPRGTTVFLSQYVTHRDGRYFDEPKEFRPDRWLGEAARRHPRYAYFPFGAGPRSCIGAGFAMLEMTAVLPTLLRHVSFEAVNASPVDVVPAVTLRPRHGVPLRVRSLMVDR